MKKITVLLAEDHIIVREGFRKMLELENDIQIVGEAADGREAVVLVKKLRPDVVLMDIAMPRLNGLEATRQIRKIVPGTKIVILSPRTMMMPMYKTQPTAVPMDFCSNKTPRTRCARRSGRSKKETNILAP